MTTNVWGSTLNGPCGIVAISAGSNTGILQDPRISAGSIVFWVPRSTDAANRRVISSVCIDGQCTLTLDGNTIGAQSWGYCIMTPQTEN